MKTTVRYFAGLEAETTVKEFDTKKDAVEFCKFMIENYGFERYVQVYRELLLC